MDTNQPRQADQDGEYLHDAHVLIAAVLASALDDTTYAHDVATTVLDTLAEAGWHLFTYDDAKSLLADHILSRVR